MLVYAVNRPELSPWKMPDRFRTDVAYFMTPAGSPGVPALGPREYWVRLTESRQWLEDLVVRVVSPLDAQAQAELELTEEQESWLEWMVSHEIEHIRLE
jgi:hypothetical protein